MNIIPVIDLKDGKVVHARMGNRKQYQPVNSILCQSSDIFDVICAFLTLYPFKNFYIADLNALSDLDEHNNLINKVLRLFNKIHFWVDAGLKDPIDFFPQKNYTPIIGSESCMEHHIELLKSTKKNFVLSLDFSINKPLGPKILFETPKYWPQTIIIMTLGHVGSNNGPAFTQLQHYRENSPNKHFVAAGGIRNSADLAALTKIGIHSALVATALHNGAITAQDIKILRAKKYPEKRGILSSHPGAT